MAVFKVIAVVAMLLGIQMFGELPADKEILISIFVDETGYQGMTHIRKSGNEYLILDEMDGELTMSGKLVKIGNKFAFEHNVDDPALHFSLADIIVDFYKLDLNKTELSFMAKEEENVTVDIQMNRRGDRIYLKEKGGKETYCIYFDKISLLKTEM